MVGYIYQGPLSAHLEMFTDTDGLQEETAEREVESFKTVSKNTLDLTKD